MADLKRWLIIGFIALWFSVYATWNLLEETNPTEKQETAGRITARDTGIVSFYVYTVCWDSICSSGECASGCFLDCAVSNCCGDGTCQSSIGENATSCAADCLIPAPSPGAGGGGGAAKIVKDFSIEPSLIKIKLLQGGLETRIVKIINSGNLPLTINIDDSELLRFTLLSEKKIYLPSKQEKILTIDFAARENESPELYTGRIFFNSNELKRILRVVIEVKQKEALFDADIRIKETFRNLFAGTPIKTELIITNLGTLKPVDVLIEYAIKDFEGNIYEKHQETMAVYDKLEIERELSTFSLKPGEYVIYTRIEYQDQKAVSSELFTVLEKKAEIPGAVCGDKKCSYTEWYSCPGDCGKPKLEIAAILLLLITIFAVLVHVNKKSERNIGKKTSRLPLRILNLLIIGFVSYLYLALYKNPVGFIIIVLIMIFIQLAVQHNLAEFNKLIFNLLQKTKPKNPKQKLVKKLKP